MDFDYTFVPGLNVWRPYIRARLRDQSTGRSSNLAPMLLDTGADHCLFNAELAHTIGVNPLDGGQIVGTLGVGGSTTTAIWPVELELPQLGDRLRIHAQFGQLPPDVGGLFGNHGFMDRFARVTLRPKAHTFALEI